MTSNPYRKMYAYSSKAYTDIWTMYSNFQENPKPKRRVKRGTGGIRRENR